ncbi:MAG: hypothetical protein IT555_17535 [Acetobacteraceae bacterium]|nr:hypothetical protein [Acetobacteraceae bacterium]
MTKASIFGMYLAVGVATACLAAPAADAAALGAGGFAVSPTGHGAIVQVQACTRQAPCTGPKGGRYYLGAGGKKKYLKR